MGFPPIPERAPESVQSHTFLYKKCAESAPLHAFGSSSLESAETPLSAQIHVRAETITEVILERAGPIMFKAFLLEFTAFRLIPVTCPVTGA